MLRILRAHEMEQGGLELREIADELAVGTPDYTWGSYDMAVCTVESVCNELVMEGLVDQVGHGLWPEQRYRAASLLELLALASR